MLPRTRIRTIFTRRLQSLPTVHRQIIPLRPPTFSIHTAIPILLCSSSHDLNHVPDRTALHLDTATILHRQVLAYTISPYLQLLTNTVYTPEEFYRHSQVAKSACRLRELPPPVLCRHLAIYLVFLHYQISLNCANNGRWKCSARYNNSRRRWRVCQSRPGGGRLV